MSFDHKAQIVDTPAALSAVPCIFCGTPTTRRQQIWPGAFSHGVCEACARVRFRTRRGEETLPAGKNRDSFEDRQEV